MRPTFGCVLELSTLLIPTRLLQEVGKCLDDTWLGTPDLQAKNQPSLGWVNHASGIGNPDHPIIGSSCCRLVPLTAWASSLFVTGLWIKPGTCGPKVGCNLASKIRGNHLHIPTPCPLTQELASSGVSWCCIVESVK